MPQIWRNPLEKVFQVDIRIKTRIKIKVYEILLGSLILWKS